MELILFFLMCLAAIKAEVLRYMGNVKRFRFMPWMPVGWEEMSFLFLFVEDIPPVAGIFFYAPARRHTLLRAGRSGMNLFPFWQPVVARLSTARRARGMIDFFMMLLFVFVF